MVTSRSRRRLSPEARRGELIDAAIRLLESGKPVTNWVQAVTAEADAAKGTFYVYFSSWEDMLVAVRDRVLSDYIDRFRRLAETTEPVDWWEAIDAECVRAIDLIGRPGGLHDAVFHGMSPTTDDGREMAEAIAAALRRGMDEGVFRSLDAHMVAMTLFAVVHAAGDAIAAGESREQWLEAVRDLTRRWLSP